MSIGDDLERWLRAEAAERTKTAAGRRGNAQTANATDADRKAAHKITEQMLGRKVPKTTRAQDAESDAIQERIAAKLDAEAAMITGFADWLRGLMDEQWSRV